ncbi:nucleotidyltransferase [Streptomyces sp. NBC_01304]|uniref:nucleotidyltransferase n=1 Tax=Streptomyces sp. NBC_01304 TaxID=2903818 RepID=UPI002E0FEB49|nr:nucleotidyltransferase [Streptomyces sp. NBC_01304]
MTTYEASDASESSEIPAASKAPEATETFLAAFVAAIVPVVPLRAVWAHGSLGGGDYQEGRSDLDLVAVLERPCTSAERAGLDSAHRRVGATSPLAPHLHCAYVPVAELGELDAPHLSWWYEELCDHRPVTEVTRRELHAFARVLHGEAPAGLLPPVTDAELSAFIRRDLTGFWRKALANEANWRQDIWIDGGLLVLARASVTLRSGRLITKAEALDVLVELGAPGELVADVRNRRYGLTGPDARTEEWLARRAELAVSFLDAQIRRVE